jgi:hypothetical protein
MANPNPSPSTRFGVGNNLQRAKQKGARDRLSAAFLAALAETFEEENAEGGTKGLEAIKKVRDEDPAAYARIFASLMPKEFEFKTPESELSDEQVEMLYHEMLARLADKKSEAIPLAVGAIAPASQRVN